jgi:hypothetical protein
MVQHSRAASHRTSAAQPHCSNLEDRCSIDAASQLHHSTAGASLQHRCSNTDAAALSDSETSQRDSSLAKLAKI